MAPLSGFSDNRFQSHDDFKIACVALLRALKPYQSSGGARIKLPIATGTHFDDVAAQLEGFARPLWAISALIRGQHLGEEEMKELVQPYVSGLANGTDPSHPEYWGPIELRDQRMVEMEIISFALLAAPDELFHRQVREAQTNITQWLRTLNGKDFPATNWLWFRVMTNLALVKVCGVPYEELKGFMTEDLDQMESFYLSEGWAADGIWDDDGRQADYYSGSFAIQFSQLLYAKMANDLDPVRSKTFQGRAVDFAASFWRYFDDNGAAIPFGRSLTYRWAFAAFFSAVAFAELDLPTPLDDWGVTKGLLLRHFRWWSDKHDSFNIDGTLTIGFCFPNMFLSEDYNSPQSPYWAMKSFIPLALSPMHPFWIAEEKLPPKSEARLTTTVKPTAQIICNTGHHHYLLSSGQFCPWPLKATEAKYGKFAYSSHFGFSVPTGPLLVQMAPDSTLALSKDGGDSWRVPWKVSSYKFRTATLTRRSQTTEVPVLCSIWKPWKDAGIEVHTALISPCDRWPDWYIRTHRIVSRETQQVQLQAVQGGFAIQGRAHRCGEVLPSCSGKSAELFANHFADQTPFPEGTFDSATGALICSNAGASGIRNLRSSECNVSEACARVLKPDANTNLMWQRSLIPIYAETKPVSAGGDALFVSAVFAMARRPGLEDLYHGKDVEKGWNDVPVVTSKEQSPFMSDHILLSCI